LTPTEELIAGVWSNLLGKSDIRRDDNFFDLGGHSLMVTQMLSRLRQVFNREIDLRAMFESPVLKDLSAHVDRLTGPAQLATARPIIPTSRDGDLPLSLQQEQLWFLEQITAGSTVYSLPDAVRLKGDLDKLALRLSLEEIVRRHEILRTSFVQVDSKPKQCIHETGNFELVERDLRETANGVATEERINREQKEEATSPFLLSQPNLFRAKLLRVAEQEHILLLTFHHIVFDGWSIGVMVNELGQLYKAYHEGQSSPLPELHIQYADYTVWQREAMADGGFVDGLEYWKKELEDLSELDLPSDHPRPAIQSFRGTVERWEMSPEASAAIRKVSQDQGVTLFMTLLAGFQILLARYSGQQDIVVGSPIANRAQPELEVLIGFFVNPLVLRGNVNSDLTVGALLQRTREVCLGAYAHQSVPFECLVDELQPERDSSRSPLFQVMLVLQNAPVSALQMHGVEISMLPSATSGARFDLTLMVEDDPVQLRGMMEYCTDLYERPTVRRILGHYQQVLSEIARDPKQSVSTLPLLTEAERHRLLFDWNDTATAFASGCIHELFEEQVEKTPNAAAVEYEGREISYAELNRRANQLAHYLRKRDLSSEELVGILLPRCSELLVAMLGVLKAGAAYVLLDTENPGQLAYILESVRPGAVVSEQRLSDELPAYAGRTVYLDTECNEISQESVQNIGGRVHPENLAYVTYQSENTEAPEAVAVPHGSVASLVRWAQSVFSADDLQRVLTSNPPTSDLSTLDTYVPLCCGGTVVVMEDSLGAADIAQSVGATLVNSAPSAMRELIRRRAAPSSVCAMILAGEPIPSGLVKRICDTTDVKRVFNLYGHTETAFCSTVAELYSENEDTKTSIGRPVKNTQAFVLDADLQLSPPGVVGELYISGASLARGYFNRPDLTADSFIPNPFGDAPGERLYCTGDLARYRAKGELELWGRSGQQIRIRGHRVDLEEIETVLERQPEVVDAVVLVQQIETTEDQLVAYIVPQNAETAANRGLERTLRVALKQRLPEYMVPSHWMTLERLPLRPDGKLDRSALPAVQAKSLATQSLSLPASDTEKTVTAIWKQILKIEEVGVEENFFDVGGQSLMIPEVHGALQKQFGTSLTVVELFQYSTVRALAERLDSEKTKAPEIAPAMMAQVIEPKQPKVFAKVFAKGFAVIGMACRFPGARNITEFWNNLRTGVESTVEFSDEELRRSGIAEAVFTSPTYVKHSAILDDVDLFDARFFNMSAREAELVDPQQRALLECAWEALEDAGYSSETYKGSVGVYAGSGAPTYLLNLGIDHKAMDPNDATPMLFANTNDLLATRVAYKLNLTGPSITVQTACSTSLVTVHVACRALLNHECDLALAGGVTIRTPQVMGDSFMEGGIVSPDGHCRTFDEQAEGTVRSNGVGVVVLKRLEDALRDRDYIHAIIRGSAINNDGSQKVGFAAPSVSGQRDVIQRALRDSGVEAETIGYVEAHGTATPMGDPIEVIALTQAFRGSTAEKAFCAVGSVKSNIGHTDCAAGVAGLIKTVLALEHKQIPATLNFHQPSPMIDFANSPFYVNATLSEWKSYGKPRRAGVSSFGIGGTNAHAVLEEAPTVDSGKDTRPYQMLVLSAKTSTALEAATSDLAAYLEVHKEVNLADVAYTLHLGRREFSHRRVIVGTDTEDALEALHLLDVKRVVTGFQEPKTRPIVFMFPGQGAQYVNMAADLYGSEPIFKQEVDRCATILQEHLGLDLRDVLYPKPDEVSTSEGAARLLQTQITQPALFVIEYALARLWMDWGVQPHAMVGHSIGEYVAACLAEVFSLEDALALVSARGRWMQSLPSGSMLVVPLPENEVIPLLNDDLSLAAVNSPEFSVVSGPTDSVDRLEQELTAKKLACRRLQTSHAFHSAMMDPILEAFAAEVRKIRLQAPQLPYMSNLTGTWITEAQATSLEYWVQHLRGTVRFADCVRELVKDPDWVLLEVGPGRTLSTLARWNPYRAQGQVVANSVRHPDDLFDDEAFLLLAAGKLWMTGVQFDWPRFYQHEQRKRLSLPTYHFERQRYWIEPKKKTTSASPLGLSTEKNKNVDEWFYVPSWKRTALTSIAEHKLLTGPWLIFSDRFGFGERLKSEAQRHGIEVFSVTEGSQYAQVADCFTICSQKDSDYQSVFKALKQAGKVPSTILYLWTIADADNNNNGAAQGDLERSFYVPLFLAQAIGSLANAPPVEWVMVSNSLYDVIGESIHHPERATLLGPCHVVPQEYPNVSCRHVDFDVTVREIPLTDAVPGLVKEIVNGSEEKVVAYRKGKRWAQIYEHLHLPANDRNVPLREKGTYLITGGLGGIGLAIAEHLAETLQARLVLVGRSAFPQRKEWEEWLETHSEQDKVSAKIRKLRSLEKMGAEVLAVSADVSDEQQIRSAIAYAQECFGPLNGVMHCAGVPGGGVIQLKTREIAEAVLAPKVKGTMVLASVLNKTQLDFFVVCSSRTSITGSFGQVDYCAANAFQDAFAHFSRQNGSPAMVGINWDAWADVGMLASAAIPGATQAEPVSQETGEKVDHPFFDARIVESADREVYATTMSPLTHWILDEHRIAGNPIIPGTAYLEMVRAAAEKYSNGKDIEIRDVFFLAPLGLREDEKREVRLILERHNAGYTFRIVSKVGEDGGAEVHWNDYSTGTVAFVEPKRSKGQDLEAIIRRCNLQQVAFTDESKRDEDLGPRWQTLKQAYVGDHELLAVFELPDQFIGDLEKLKMHPSLLDRSMEIGKHFLFPVGVYLPMGYRRLTIKQPLGKRIYTHVIFDPAKRQDGETMLCDVTIFDERGEQLLEIDSFSQKRVNDIAAQIKAVAKKQYHSNRSAPSAKDTALASVYAEAMEQGLSVREGLEALRRILQLKSEPQVIVSTNDLQTMILQAGSLRPMAEMLAQAADAPVAAGSRHPRPAIATPYQAPNTPVEQKIAEVWQQVLGIDQIGVDDNIFDLGGDSVQGIQIVARINQQGFQLTAAQLFEHQTIASLAAVAAASETVHAEQGEILGDVSITPVQRRFLEQNYAAIQHHHSVLLSGPANTNTSFLRRAVSSLMSHHDALRTRFELVASEWQQKIVSLNDEDVSFSEIDLSKSSPADQLVEFDREVARLQTSLDLTHGPLFRVVYFLLGSEVPGRLLLIAHALVADRLSMTTMVEDLNLAYQQLVQGIEVHLPEKTTSYQYWASELLELANSSTIREETSEWLDPARSMVADPPVDLPGGNNTVESEVSISRLLESEETKSLLQHATAVNHCDANELLLTALAGSLSKSAAINELLVDIEAPGREEVFPDVNLSRTVGAFATTVPVLLQKLHLEDLGKTLQSVKEQVRRIPRHGIGYGLLRHQTKDLSLSSKLRSMPQAQIRFSYLGHLDPQTRPNDVFEQLTERVPHTRDPRTGRGYLFEVRTYITDGKLRITWVYSNALHRSATVDKLIEGFVDTLQKLITLSASTEAERFSPSDFPLAGLDEKGLLELEYALAETGESTNNTDDTTAMSGQ
jgi:amino acid adenylation domain-containing protein/non-ribosomal peptide synthase protein (TIGR01720 family)